jgi:hypothetical protein
MRRIDIPTWIALACLLLGWFSLNTVVATLGPIQHGARFFDLAVAMRNPGALFTGVAGDRSVGTVIFGAFCLGIAALPLYARLATVRYPRLLSCAPLLLILLCCIVLYVKASTTHLQATGSMGRVGDYLARWYNSASDWAGDLAVRHIAIGLGGYLSFYASIWLALAGLRDFRVLAPPQGTDTAA